MCVCACGTMSCMQDRLSVSEGTQSSEQIVLLDEVQRPAGGGQNNNSAGRAAAVKRRTLI